MGSIYYANTAAPIEVPDRLLAHIKVVIATKLRRGESFTISWRHPEGQDEGRSTLWMHPAIPVRFVFEAPEPEALNAAVLKDMADQAGASSGLTVALDMEVPAADAPRVSSPRAAAPATASARRVSVTGAR